MDYKNLTDEQLVKLSKEDALAKETLIKRYNQLTTSIANKYFLCGGDADDLYQEGRIGLVNAIDTFTGVASFKTYACVCIKNRIISAIRSYAVKNKPFSDCIYFTSVEGDAPDKNGIIKDNAKSPEETYINGEAVSELLVKIKDSLSKTENQVLTLMLDGNSNLEIENALKKDAKAVENAKQRIRKKITSLLENR